jgi:fructose-specific phosphotransferase system component IIB
MLQRYRLKNPASLLKRSSSRSEIFSNVDYYQNSIKKSIKEPFQEIQKTQKEATTQPNVVQLGNSGTEYTLEGLALCT